MPPLTYLEFHLMFILPPFVALTVAAVSKPKVDSVVHPAGVAIIALVALAYTVPWDNYLIARGVWVYGPNSVILTVWHAPLSEYLFILLQPIMVALWLDRFRVRVDTPLRIGIRARLAGTLAAAVIGFAGWLLLGDTTYYLGAILVWAAPVLALQWAFGWPYLWKHRRKIVLGVLVPTLYLWFADRIAIGVGVWRLAPQYTTGVTLFGLPVEEATFFLVTTLFVVQGLVLFDWVVTRWH